MKAGGRASSVFEAYVVNALAQAGHYPEGQAGTSSAREEKHNHEESHTSYIEVTLVVHGGHKPGAALADSGKNGQAFETEDPSLGNTSPARRQFFHKNTDVSDLAPSTIPNK